MPLLLNHLKQKRRIRTRLRFRVKPQQPLLPRTFHRQSALPPTLRPLPLLQQIQHPALLQQRLRLNQRLPRSDLLHPQSPLGGMVGGVRKAINKLHPDRRLVEMEKFHLLPPSICLLLRRTMEDQHHRLWIPPLPSNPRYLVNLSPAKWDLRRRAFLPLAQRLRRWLRVHRPVLRPPL